MYFFPVCTDLLVSPSLPKKKDFLVGRHRLIFVFYVVLLAQKFILDLSRKYLDGRLEFLDLFRFYSFLFCEHAFFHLYGVKISLVEIQCLGFYLHVCRGKNAAFPFSSHACLEDFLPHFFNLRVLLEKFL